MRLLELSSSPLDGRVKLPIKLTGEERFSELYLFTASVLLEEEKLSPQSVLGKSMTVDIAAVSGGDARKINGLISGYRACGETYNNLYRHEFELRPAFWLATLTERCRIFQDKAPRQIIEEVLGDYSGKIGFKMQISAATKVREYCVQYNETDWEFLSRLMAEEGIYYYVQYKAGGSPSFDQELVIADRAAAYHACQQSDVMFRQDQSDYGGIVNWSGQDRVHTNEWTFYDYNYLSPTRTMKQTATTRDSNRSESGAKRYRGFGRFRDADHGSHLAGVGMEREEVDSRTFHGEGTLPHFCVGAKFRFADNPDWTDGSEFVLAGVRHEVRDLSAIRGAADEGEEPTRYHNWFDCLPSDAVSRPRPIHKNARMRGPQTAIVVGPSGGDDIYTDEHGRIKVRLHWDLEPTSQSDPTCWMRVAQAFAGNNFGAQFIPRIGMEVLVDFIEGDQDRPIVVGCVYNGDNRPPFSLTAEKTKSGWRTQSSPTSGEIKINELHFEDKAGDEKIYFHAGKDFTRYVFNDDDLKVDNKQTREIKADRITKITEGHDKLTVLKGDKTLEVTKGDFKTTVSQGHQILGVTKGDYKISVNKGKQISTIQDDYVLTVKAGDQKTKISAGASTLDAKTKILLKVGPSSILMDMKGITIKAPMIKIAATIKADLKAPMVKIKAAAMGEFGAGGILKLNAGGMTMLKGGIVMIN